MVLFMQEMNTKQEERALQLKCMKSFISKLKVIDEKTAEVTFSAEVDNHEELEAAYLAAIKSLLRNADPNTLEDFYKAMKMNPRILKPLLHYSHHGDSMVRSAARTGLLMVFQKCGASDRDYVFSFLLPKHMNAVVLFLKKTAIEILFRCIKGDAREQLQQFVEELEYVEDLLRLNSDSNRVVVASLFDNILPFLLSSLAKTKTEECWSPLFPQTSLFLLAVFFENISDKYIRDDLTLLILTSNRSDFHSQKISSVSQEVFEMLQSKLKCPHQVECTFVLNLLQKVQLHISDDLLGRLQFFRTYGAQLLELLIFNKDAINKLSTVRLKLIGLILDPYAKCKSFKSTSWQKLQGVLYQALETLYINICEEFNNMNIFELVTLIDEEYKEFVDGWEKFNFNELLARLIEDQSSTCSKEGIIKAALSYLFHIRHLFLKLQCKKEKILPIIKIEGKIGLLMPIDACVPLEKLAHGDVFITNHYLKLTKNQILILQQQQEEPEPAGIVVFNALYKDIVWVKHSKDTFSIFEQTKNEKKKKSKKKKSKSQCFICLKFPSSQELKMVIDFLDKAKHKQISYIRKKLEDLFLISLT